MRVLQSEASGPRWSPDGQRIVFDSDRNEAGNLEIYSMKADGSDVQQLTRGRESITPDWSR